MQLLRAGDRVAALATAKELARDAPDVADAHQLLGVCCAEMADAKATISAFERALTLAPEQPVILFNYAAAQRKLGAEASALACLQRAVAAAPGYSNAWIELGQSALRLDQAALALLALTRALELQPDSATAWHAYGSAQRANNRLESAEAAFRRSLELSPKAATTWVNLGAVLRLRGRADQAIECFETAQRLGLAGAELGDALAGAWLDVGDPAQSLARAREVVRGFPAFVPAQVTLAHLLWEYGGGLAPAEDALAAFRAAVAAQPAHLEMRLALAQFLLAAQQLDEALHHIRILRRHAEHPSHLRMEANALHALGQTDAAAELFAALDRQLTDRDPTFLNDYVRHLLTTGRIETAAARALEATRIDPENQTSWAYLSTAWRLLDDPREHWLCDYDHLIALLPVEPPAGLADQAAFLDALRQSIEPLHLAAREPVQQSLRGGSQTPGRLFGRDSVVLAATQQSLLQTVNDWLHTLVRDRNHPFRGRITAGVQICGSWSVKLWTSGKHVNHIHPQGWMSSAFYLALPPSVTAPINGDSQPGFIQFGQPPSELGLGLPPRRVICPEVGKLALFPSYMWHGTVPFSDQQPRISIAFDMTPEQP